MYFLLDDGVLIINRYAQVWYDTVLPDLDLEDVSNRFMHIVGNKIEKFTFRHKETTTDETHHGRPVVRIKMDNSSIITFSTNIGKVADQYRAAFYYIL